VYLVRAHLFWSGLRPIKGEGVYKLSRLEFCSFSHNTRGENLGLERRARERVGG